MNSKSRLLIVCLLSVLSSYGAIPVHASSMEQCAGQFNGTIVHGPDTGSAISGTITLSVADDGTVTGSLVQSDSTTVDVIGKFHQRIIKLEFSLSTGSIKGVGQLRGGFTPCTTNFGGHFVGPQPSDIGDWGIIWGS